MPRPGIKHLQRTRAGTVRAVRVGMTKHTNKFIVQTSSAKMPTSCWGRYRNVAVLEVDAEHVGGVAMISDRARGVVRIVHHSGPQFEGKTDSCAYGRALAWAESYAEELNAELAAKIAQADAELAQQHGEEFDRDFAKFESEERS